MTSKHSLISPSAAKRWFRCPASPHFQKQPQSNIHAASGTLVHSICEWTVSDNSFIELETFTGKQKYLPEELRGKEILSPEGYIIKVTQKMFDDAQIYADKILGDAYYYDIADKNRFVEQKIELPHISPELYGTCDCYQFSDDTLLVYDYKNGKKEVPIEDNHQMLIYTLGVFDAMEKKLFPANLDHWLRLTIVMTIVQPNGGKNAVKSQYLSAYELNRFRIKLKEAVDRVFAPNPSFIKGDCSWCGHMANCPEYDKKAKHLELISEIYDVTDL